MSAIALRAGAWAAAVVPGAGGAIASLRRGSAPVLRETPDDAVLSGDVRRMACYAMLPYANRIADAAFEFGGRRWQLRRNFGDHPHSLHGIGWQRAWQVEAASPTRVRLALRHAGDADWPFPFRAVQEIALEDGLSIRIALTNTGAGAAPAGFGFHPFFPRAPESRADFNAARGWRNGPDMLPVRGDLAPVYAVGVDNDFEGWDGEVRIGSTVLRADPVFRWLRLFAPEDRPFIAAEPVTHAANAINRSDTGMTVLAPGETLAGEMRIGIA